MLAPVENPQAPHNITFMQGASLHRAMATHMLNFQHNTNEAQQAWQWITNLSTFPNLLNTLNI